MQTFCPKCGTKLGADESLIGKQAQCGKCGNRFTVTPSSLPATSAVATPESVAAAAAENPHETRDPELTASPMPSIGTPLPSIGSARAEDTAGSNEPAPASEETPAAGPEVSEPPKKKPPIAPRLKSESAETAPAEAAEGEQKPCPKCGASLPGNAVLCTQCGTFLKETKPAEAKSSKKMLWQIVGGVLLILLIGGLTLGRKVYRAYRGIKHAVEDQQQQQPQQQPMPGPPGAPGGPPGGPPGLPGAPPRPPKPSAPAKPATPFTAASLPPIAPEDMEAISKLPAHDPTGATASEPRHASLSLRGSLLESVDLKGPSRDRYQSDIAPKISAQTRLVTLRMRWRQEELDQPVMLNTESLKFSTDVGPGVLYGVEFFEFASFSGWQPKGATTNSTGILESVQLTARSSSDMTTDLLASGALLGRPAFGKWFELMGKIRDKRLKIASVSNQFVPGANTPLQTEQGSLFLLDPHLNVHVLIPSTARLVRLQFGESRPWVFPIDALSSIPATEQPEPLPFINATVDKARPFLDSAAPEDMMAGAALLAEAGNLDAQRKLKEAAFKGWLAGVTQLLAHAEVELRAVGVEVVLRSHRVEPRLRTQLLAQAVQDAAPEVRRRAAQLGEKPSLLDVAFKETMEQLQKLLADSNTHVRVTAHVNNLQLAAFGDDSTFDFLKENVQKGLMDPSPLVRSALLRSMLMAELWDERTGTQRLATLLQFARLNLFDPNEGVRADAAKTILSIRSPVSTTIVADALQQVPDKTAELFAAASLEVVVATEKELPLRVTALNNKQAQIVLAQTLAKFLEDPTPRLRQSAARVLGALDPEVANEALAAAATNSDAGVRLVAFSSFIGTERKFMPPSSLFADGLNDPEPKVRGAAFALLEEIKDDPESAATVASNVVEKVASPAIRFEVAKKFAATAVTNAPMLLALQPFLADKDSNVWRIAIAPWSKTTTRYPWPQIEPIWKLLIEQPAPRRYAAFWPLRLATADTNSPPSATAGAVPEAIGEATKLLADADPLIREQALLFVVPYRRAEDIGAIEKILADPQVDISASAKNQVMVALARPSVTEDLSVVDRIRPATEEDKRKEREALNAASTPPPGSKSGTRTSFVPVSYRVTVPTTSLSGMYLLTKWAASQNPSANAAGNYLLKVVPSLATRSWLLPSERAVLLQSLRKLSEVPTVAATAKVTLGQIEARFPAGAAGKTLSVEQTQGAADSVDSLAAFVGPKKKPMIIATFKHPSGAMIDVWYNADETIPETYPHDAAELGPGQTWKFVSKLEGTRVDPLDKETVARLEWAAANAPKDKLRAALEKVAQAEGDLSSVGRRLAMEGFVLLAEQGDADAEAAAVKLGWLKM